MIKKRPNSRDEELLRSEIESRVGERVYTAKQIVSVLNNLGVHNYGPARIADQALKNNLGVDACEFGLKNPTQNIERTDIFWHYPHFSNQLGRPAGAIRLGDWKLVKSYETNKIELFNIANDIAETNDLSKTNISKANELHDLLLKRLKEMNANMPIKK